MTVFKTTMLCASKIFWITKDIFKTGERSKFSELGLIEIQRISLGSMKTELSSKWSINVYIASSSEGCNKSSPSEVRVGNGVIGQVNA